MALTLMDEPMITRRKVKAVPFSGHNRLSASDGNHDGVGTSHVSQLDPSNMTVFNASVKTKFESQVGVLNWVIG
jgi:hypothetical protein